MSPVAQRDLYALCIRLWSKVRLRLSKVKLDRHRWEDLRAVAVARVFSRIWRFRADRGRMVSWVFVILYRSAQNQLRKILPSNPNKDANLHVWRTNLLMARPLAITVKQTGVWGEEITVVEPDIMDPADASRPHPFEVEEFRSSLGPEQQALIDLAFSGQTLRRVMRALRIRDYNTLHRRVTTVRQKWDAYQRGDRPPAGVTPATAQRPAPKPSPLPLELEQRLHLARAVPRTGLHATRCLNDAMAVADAGL